MTTQTDIHGQVTASFAYRADAHDIDAIVTDFIATYGLVPIATIPASMYRDIVQRHDYDAPMDAD